LFLYHVTWPVVRQSGKSQILPQKPAFIKKGYLNEKSSNAPSGKYSNRPSHLSPNFESPGVYKTVRSSHFSSHPEFFIFYIVHSIRYSCPATCKNPSIAPNFRTKKWVHQIIVSKPLTRKKILSKINNLFVAKTLHKQDAIHMDHHVVRQYFKKPDND